MTLIPPTISYASPQSGQCPLCQKRAIGKKAIYTHPVCKKCFYKFANRRQLGYLVDAIAFLVPNALILYLIASALAHTSVSAAGTMVLTLVAGIGLACVFCLRDSIDGRSPGKWLADTQVVNELDHQPISYEQSFKRNSILLLGQIPVAGGFIALVILIIITVQVGKGYRLGDRFAKTKVIWKKYEHLPVFGGDALVCLGCGYNLHGNVSGICPECGGAIPAETQARLVAAN
jgi:uncharacterized RDD family membrane protein YckC